MCHFFLGVRLSFATRSFVHSHVYNLTVCNARGVACVYNNTSIRKKMTIENLCFYTCFYGKQNDSEETNEAFRVPPIPSKRFNCYFVTNDESMVRRLSCTNWIPILDTYSVPNPIRTENEACFAAKRVKAMPHLFPDLAQYDYTCYLDSKLGFVSEAFVLQMIVLYMCDPDSDSGDGKALLLREHSCTLGWTPKKKYSAWYEYELSQRQERYKREGERYERYIQSQLDKGMKKVTKTHCATGFLIRNMRHPRIQKLDKVWYKHIQKCGIECQIAFFFAKQAFENDIYVMTEYPFVELQ